MSEEILNVSSLSVSFRDRKKGIWKKDACIQILKDITFSMKKGEILGLVGESGSGKSTLAKAILGLTPYRGQVVHESENPQMIFQDPYGSLNPSRRIGWILEEALRLKGDFSEKERRVRVYEMLNRVGLDEKLTDRYPSQLSGGQRQRVCIACALMQEPELLIADEPVSALDVTIQAQILELILKIQQETGISVLFISHDLRVVYQMCNRVMIMKRGEIVECGEVEEVYFNHQNEYTGNLLHAAGIY